MVIITQLFGLFIQLGPLAATGNLDANVNAADDGGLLHFLSITPFIGFVVKMLGAPY